MAADFGKGLFAGAAGTAAMTVSSTLPGSAAPDRDVAARHSGQSESGEESDGYEERTLAYQRFRRELLGAERAVLLRLRSEGRISDEVRRRVERDLEDARLEI